jgi:hypothetical protein
MKSNITLILGASVNPERYSYLAANKLLQHGHEVLLVGKTGGAIAGHAIESSFPEKANVDTVTLYINPTNQKQYYESILKLKPRRIIFNPGAENAEFEKLAQENNIATEEACTLVLLSTGQY